MPKRPRWSYTMSKHEVEKNEEKMFIKHVDDIKKENLGTQLSYFEMNLEVKQYHEIVKFIIGCTL